MDTSSTNFKKNKIKLSTVFFSLLLLVHFVEIFGSVDSFVVKSIFILVKFTVWPANRRRSIGLLWSFINFGMSHKISFFLPRFFFNTLFSHSFFQFILHGSDRIRFRFVWHCVFKFTSRLTR